MNNLSKFSQKGFSLIELMISVVIGLFLIIAASYAFQEAQRTYTINDNVARLQEQAQFVLDTLEEDIRMSSFWGLHNRFSAVSFDSTLPATITGDCTVPWALTVTRGMTGTNNANPSTAATVNNWADTGCISAANTWQTGTDSLVIRHAGSEIIPDGTLDPNKIYVASVETPLSTVFTTIDTNVPSGTNPDSKVYEFQAHGYYIRDFSYAAGDDTPMMRKLTLISGPAVQDRELAIGVEDFQIEYGIDTSGYASANRGSINRYITPDNPILIPTDVAFNPEAEILSVKVWLLMRAENEEMNYINDNIYSYAGNGVVAPFNDAYRRLLVSSTFYIRNRERN